MPQYYNPYSMAYPTYGYPVPAVQSQTAPQYMFNVDGESAARAWQVQGVPQPNMIIPLFDTDGQHVYFKSYDAYGRMNPIRKGRIVFDDEVQQSESVEPKEYVAKEEFDSLMKEIQQIKQDISSLARPANQNIQNGNNFRGDKR